LFIIVLTLFSVWFIPLFKIWSEIAIWHILLITTLYFILINRHKFHSFLKVVKLNYGFLIIILLFPLFILTRDGFGDNLGATLNDYILRGICGLLLSLCIATHFRSENDKRLLFLILGIILACNALIGILQVAKPNIFFGLPEKLAYQADIEHRFYDGRIRGMFIHVHIFSQHMLGLTSLFLAGIFFVTKKTKNFPGSIFFILMTVLGVVSIIFTFTRSAYLGIIINILIIVYFLIRYKLTKYKKSLKRLLFISGFLLISIFIITKAFDIFEMKESGRLIYLKNSGDKKRIETFKLSIISFQNYPYYGTGGRIKLGDTAIHNIFLKTLVYYGIFGLLIYLFFYLSLFMKIKAISKKYLIYKIGLFLWLASYLLYGMVHTAGFWLGGLIEWTFVGLILSLIQPRNNRSDSQRA